MQNFRFIGAMVDMDLVCIIMYCQDTILKEVRGLMNKLYAYALYSSEENWFT